MTDAAGRPVEWDEPIEPQGFIDHTLLSATASRDDISRLCREARRYEFAAVCVSPCRVAQAVGELEGSGVETATVVSFPLGADSTAVKAAAAAQAVADGATEIDLVMNLGAFAEGDDETVLGDIREVRAACGDAARLKVILETACWSPERIADASEIAVRAGAHFVKTSTGLGPGGATVEAVDIMRRTVGPDIGVKASGGIRDLTSLAEMIRAGASRIGTSSGVAIMEEAKQ